MEYITSNRTLSAPVASDDVMLLMIRPELRDARSYVYNWPASGLQLFNQVSNVDPTMDESSAKMCSFTMNGHMYLAGGEEPFGYSIWRLSSCCFHVTMNYNRTRTLLNVL